MTQQDDARRALSLIGNDQNIEEGIRRKIQQALNDPVDTVVQSKLDTVRDVRATEKVRLAAADDIITLARGGTLP